MCIEQVPAFRHAGKLYDTELKAVEAAIQDIGATIVKEHSASVHIGLVKHREALTRLLGRHQELSPDPTPTEVTSSNGTGEPKRGTEA